MTIHVPRRGTTRSWLKLAAVLVLSLAASVLYANRAHAAARFHDVDVNATIGAQLEQAEHDSGVPVLVPPSIPVRFKTLHASVAASPGDYEISLSSVANCGSATACLAGSFAGSTTTAPAGPHRVRLHHCVRARFRPLTCGGSCSAPAISFRLNGVTYTLSLRDLPGTSDRRALAHLANALVDGVSD